MISLADRILEEFPSGLERLWIVADPDGILLDESILASLHQRGFDLLRYEDSVAFRAEYEKRYRAPWDTGGPGPSESLILHLRGADVSRLPWDYLRRSRRVSLSLANLFANLSCGVVRQLASDMLPALFEAQNQHVGQPLGETATREFVLLHLFRLSPHLITRPEDLWRELLGVHYRDLLLPQTLAEYVECIVADRVAFKNVPVARLFSDKSLTLRVVQDAWYEYLASQGVTGTRVSEPASLAGIPAVEIPFDHHDVRALVDAMFLDGLLHPLVAREIPAGLPEWIQLGVVQRAGAVRDLILDGIKNLTGELPDSVATYRAWARFARLLGELIARFQRLDVDQVKDVEASLRALVSDVDDRLQEWVAHHYSDLPSLPVAKAPVMVHHVPRYLAMRRLNGESRIALVVFDGLAMDQWVHVRESIVQRTPQLLFDEKACFAWLPTLTSVSRQAIFSGQLPREFPESIGNTSREPMLWTRFWENQGLRASEVFYRKSLRRADDLPDLDAQLSNPAVKVAGLVVDTVDEIIHGAVLGKRGVASQLTTWCETGFVNDLFQLLLRHQFDVYLTADHGNAEAIGVGRMNQGVASELRGERVRTYRSEGLIAESSASNPATFRMAVGGLPPDFLPLFASGRGAFVPKGEPVVAHGGMSLEELVVPFVNVRLVN